MYYFADFGAPTPYQEKSHMFGLGAEFGQEIKNITFTQLAFICEAWVATVAKGEKRTWKRPVDAPNRREALIMQLVEIQPTPNGKADMKQSIKQAEILRHGGIVDLGDITEEITVTSLTFPAYFIAGYTASQMSPQDMESILKEVMNS
jgi:hypothetical protein